MTRTPFDVVVSNVAVRKLTALAVVVVLVAMGILLLRQYDRIPWVALAAHLHAQRGSIDCGHIFNTELPKGGAHTDTGVQCALSAHKSRQPFVVIFTVNGIDSVFSDAIVENSQGKAIEIVYFSGMVSQPGLFRHTCATPVQFQVESSDISLLHCLPWPPTNLERDWILW